MLQWANMLLFSELFFVLSSVTLTWHINEKDTSRRLHSPFCIVLLSKRSSCEDVSLQHVWFNQSILSRFPLRDGVWHFLSGWYVRSYPDDNEGWLPRRWWEELARHISVVLGYQLEQEKGTRLWSCMEQSKKVVTNMIMVTPEAFPVTVLNSVISLQKKLIKPENYKSEMTFVAQKVTYMIKRACSAWPVRCKTNKVQCFRFAVSLFEVIPNVWPNFVPTCHETGLSLPCWWFSHLPMETIKEQLFIWSYI